MSARYECYDSLVLIGENLAIQLERASDNDSVVPLREWSRSVGVSKVGVASQCRSCEICLRLMRGEGETSLGLDGGWQVFFAPGFNQLHGNCFQGYFDS